LPIWHDDPEVFYTVDDSITLVCNEGFVNNNSGGAESQLRYAEEGEWEPKIVQCWGMYQNTSLL